ncbi:unnamed protein product, partial [Prorocentrum cordatum]
PAWWHGRAARTPGSWPGAEVPQRLAVRRRAAGARAEWPCWAERVFVAPPPLCASGDHLLQPRPCRRVADGLRHQRPLRGPRREPHGQRGRDRQRLQGELQAAGRGLRRPARPGESRRAFDESGARQANMSYEEAERMWRSWGMAGADDEGQQRREDRETRRKGIALLLLALAVCAVPQQLKLQALELCLWLLPGFAVSAVGVALMSSREEQPKWLWCALLLLMASYGARRILGVSPARTEVPNAPTVVGTPHSGELVLTEDPDGRLALVSDPAAPSGDAAAGWQQRLVGEMTDTIKRGQEQVVTVFSREGCPWCDRQLPVLERAIQGRAGLGGGAAAAALAPAFALPTLLGRAAVGLPGGGAAPMGRGAGILFAPLRVFVFDAGEFPSMAQSFNVKAFPTTMAWGSPGVAPMVAQGYLDDEKFDQLLRAVAQATPEGPAPEQKKKRGLFR